MPNTTLTPDSGQRTLSPQVITAGRVALLSLINDESVSEGTRKAYLMALDEITTHPIITVSYGTAWLITDALYELATRARHETGMVGEELEAPCTV